MKITDLRYIFNEGRAIAELKVNGTQARIGAGQKYAANGYGIVWLGDQFDDLMPKFVIPAIPEEAFSRRVVSGFTNDPAIFAIWETLIEMGETGDLPK